MYESLKNGSNLNCAFFTLTDMRLHDADGSVFFVTRHIGETVPVSVIGLRVATQTCAEIRQVNRELIAKLRFIV